MMAAACGDDDGAGSGGLSDGEQAIADAIALDMTADPEPGDPFSDAAAARCFSEGIVDSLGIARLAEIGITANAIDSQAAFATMSETEINTMADLMLGCVDVETAMTEQFATDGISDGSARCMAKAFGETDFYRAAFIAGMTGDDSYDPTADPEFLGTMITAATDCLTAEELAVIMGG
ncbi:MAG: hypothetical protein MUP76_06060, partial [Acidimicrobiia bacterium]|nr:hypothetical protein [Acidimicrobiia bacterium]